MQPSLAPLFEFEMLDRIGDIDLRPVDYRLAERSVEDLTRRTNERLSCQIFPVAGLFTNKQHPRINSAFRSEAHTSELQSLMRITYAVTCLTKNTTTTSPLSVPYSS